MKLECVCRGSLRRSQPDVDPTDGFVCRPASGPGNARHAQTHVHLASRSNTLSHGLGDLRAHCPIFFQQRFGHPEQFDLRMIAVTHHCPYVELPGTCVRRCAISPPVQLSARAMVNFRARRRCPTTSSMVCPSMEKTDCPNSAITSSIRLSSDGVDCTGFLFPACRFSMIFDRVSDTETPSGEAKRPRRKGPVAGRIPEIRSLISPSRRPKV